MNSAEPYPLSAAQRRQIDLVCDDFERVWQQGPPPDIATYLARLEAPLRPALEEELLRLDLEWRCRKEGTPHLETYHQCYPRHADALAGWLAEGRTAADLVRRLPETVTGLTSTPSVTPANTPRATADRPAACLPRLLGEYELLRLLGAGGMGEVYEGRHRRLGKRVAVKLLPVGRHASKEALERFAREIAAIGPLDHPHLVEAHDAGEQEGVLYLVLKYLDGIDLKKLVERDGPLAVVAALDLTRQAALGLQHLHERGLVHRDVKPGNLMRATDGPVKVLDLGLARWYDSAGPASDLTGAGQGMGTPDYMAPEQAEDAARADIQADLYGLGGTLFYLLTGRAPFAHHQNLRHKLNAHATESPPDVRSLRADVPAAVAAVVARLLAKRPEERSVSAQELADELTRLLAGLKSAPPGTTVDYVPARPRRPLLRRLALPLGLAAAALLTFAVVKLFWNPTPPASPGNPTEQKDPAKPDTPAERILVRKLEVRHLAKVGNFDQPKGNLGERSFTTHLEDAVTIAAELSETAYCYLIAYRPNGTEELCFPEDEQHPPPRTDRPRYPSVKAGDTYGLTDGTGLEAFFLVVSRKPLPAYAEWRKARGESPWRKTEALPNLVWRYDGVEVLAVTPEHPAGQRGKGRELQGGGVLGRLADWLRQAPEIEAVAGIGFPVLDR